MKFLGYRRPDRGAGLRNHVLIIPSVVCANRVARGISQQVTGTTWVEHQHGCCQLGVDADLTMRVLVAHGTHPNVYGVVVVGLGCETLRAQDVATKIKEQCPYKPVHLVIIQDRGGSIKATADGATAAREIMVTASCLMREPIDTSELILGTECGGSDACSGISANPALGVASDMLIDEGGSVVLAETTELVGAEHLVAARAVNDQVANRCFEVISRCEKAAIAMGVDMRGGQPTPGNIEGGLSSIEEKSLGCVYKAGTKPLQDVPERFARGGPRANVGGAWATIRRGTRGCQLTTSSSSRMRRFSSRRATCFATRAVARSLLRSLRPTPTTQARPVAARISLARGGEATLEHVPCVRVARRPSA